MLEIALYACITLAGLPGQSCMLYEERVSSDNCRLAEADVATVAANQTRRALEQMFTAPVDIHMLRCNVRNS